MSLGKADVLRLLGAAAMVVVGGVHLQQYVALLSEVPTIGESFLLNAAGAAAIAAALLLPDRPVRLLAAAGGVVLSIASLVAIALAQGGGIFGYQETSLRAAVVVAIVSEVIATGLLGGYLAMAARRMRLGSRSAMNASVR